MKKPSSLEGVTEVELQGAGLVKLPYEYGFGHRLYSSSNHVYLTHKNTGEAIGSRRKEPFLETGLYMIKNHYEL